MNEYEKSLKLAKLMGLSYNIIDCKDGYMTIEPTCDHIRRESGDVVQYTPYESDEEGLAQFAAILLKFPEVFPERLESYVGFEGWIKKPTQANILDEILVMNGVEI